jgi:hypothetical protein
MIPASSFQNRQGQDATWCLILPLVFAFVSINAAYWARIELPGVEFVSISFSRTTLY